MRRFILLFILIVPTQIIAQENDLYWINRRPYMGYWQQDVTYKIDARLDDEKEVIEGELVLTYTNNSPDVLKALYFHLYQNAFEPESYMNKFSGHSPKDSVFQHIEVMNLKVNGVLTKVNRDNTLLKVILDNDQTISTGERVVITINFKTFFGPENGRMKSYEQHGHKHFNVVHWYPRISVYDRKFGWTTDQHLGSEFYGDFGSFEVNITIPEHYILDATGIMTNRAEVLPPQLMEKLDIKNFESKPWGEAPSEIIAKSSKTKTWKFQAENVHDFAWTADPAYRIGKATAKLENGREIDCYSLAQEQHASGWQNAAEYTAKVIELYSKDFGEYVYPKMIVADARDGMEYPMLTLDGGRDPYYRDLLAHEVGHNWFFGMIGSNETYQAALDEGFTQFLTSWAMEHLEGDTIPWSQRNYGLQIGKTQARDTRTEQVYQGYYRSAISLDDDPRLNTHSDHFETGNGYSQVYYKTAVMLYNLQYVLGDSLFLESMQHYFNQWKFCHPYFEDFRASIIGHAGVDLNWFFDQWLESDMKIDYKIVSFKQSSDSSYILKLARKGEMQMPIALTLQDREGNQMEYWIPNTDFVKNTDATVLPKWVGWNDKAEGYEVELSGVSNIKRVLVDGSERLADVNQLNNSIPFPIDVQFDNLSYNYPEHAYMIEWRPSLWYNGFDGIKLGLQFKGDYYQTRHVTELGAWYNTGLGQQTSELFDRSLRNNWCRFNYRVGYSTPLNAIGKKANISIKSSFLDGVFLQNLSWKVQLPNKKTSIAHSFGSIYLPGDASLNYPVYSQLWNTEKFNNYTDLELTHRYRYGIRSQGRVKSILRSPFGFSDYQYGYLNLEAINDNQSKNINLRTRVFGQLGFGSNWAPESQLMLSGANAEQMLSNPWIRSAGFIPASEGVFDGSTSWFQSGGGLGLRGYSGYVAPEINGDSLLRFAYAGKSGLALNTELEFDDFVSLLPSFVRWIELKTYLFADAGLIGINYTIESFEFSSLRADAGLGVALEIKQWGDLTDLRPTVIRVDFPLWLNRPPANQDFLQFRWLVAIDRAF